MPIRKSKVKSQKVKVRFKIRIFVFLILILTFDFLILNFDCAASPCYGTTMPLKNQFFAGLQNYSLFKRDLEDNAGTMRSEQYFFLLSYGIFDWLSLDLKGGVGNIRQRSSLGPDLDYPTFLGGGYGFRLKLFDLNKIKAVFGFQHTSVHPYTVDLGGQKNKGVLDDWQFSALASYAFKMFTPYLGTRWSRCDYIHWVNDQRELVQSDLSKSVGLIFGVDVPVTKRAWINIEGQWLDSEAVAGSINFRF